MGGLCPPLRFDGPAIVFGGPYGNLDATRALLDEATRLGVAADRIVCTGDVVAYGADAAGTVGLVRAAGIHVVMGNCEESLAAQAADCGCGYLPGSACDRLAAAWFAHADRELDADARAWMARLPRRIDVVIAGARLAVVHGGVGVINRFVFASTVAAIKAEELTRSGVDGVIAGHCGLPFTQIVQGKLWHNAGAVGMPANDGTPRVWFTLLTPRPDGLAIEHRALAYDHAAAAAKMRRAGLPEGYAEALETGLWPSCDVLPYKEIRERGVPLEPGRATWTLPPSTPAPRRRRPIACDQLWPDPARDSVTPLGKQKFADPRVTAAGEPRAEVALARLRTLWFNTGTQCNIACRNCYIESSPKNDRLVYLERGEVAAYLDEIERDGWDTEEIGFTGGEPFMNPHLFGMMEDCLTRGFRVLVLTNAMRPMQRAKAKLLDLNRRLGQGLTIRVSLDHFTPERHEDERGPGTYQPTLDGLIWLARNGFNLAVAGRTMWGEDAAAERDGYARLFAAHAIPIDAQDPDALVLFPEMDARVDVPEITQATWGALGKSPADLMCATSRMVVKRKGAERPTVLACTLVAYDPQFELGATLKDAARPVPLNHPHCARFCVIGGALCSAG
ncbi:MAG TPA: radical SAM protein [Xanthobacteraceae bacterium]|nr:radical SAM protein [Xanthobacteraceae bacterium]